MKPTNILALVLAMLAVGCASAPHEIYPGTLPEDLPADEYIAFDDEGHRILTCEPLRDDALVCEGDDIGDDEIPSGPFFQDGLVVSDPGIRTPISKAAVPLKVVQGARTYDIVVHITRDKIFVNGEALVELDDGHVHPDDKRGDLRSLFIEPLYQRLAELRGTSETPPSSVIIADGVSRYGLVTEVLYTMGQARVLSEMIPMAVERARHSLWISCRPGEDHEGQLICHIVGDKGRDEDGVRHVELVTVSNSYGVLARLTGKMPKRIREYLQSCDSKYVREVARRAYPKLRDCVDHLVGDYEKLHLRYRVDESEGFVVDDLSGPQASPDVRQCMARELSKLEVDTSRGQGCTFRRSIPIPLEE